MRHIYMRVLPANCQVVLMVPDSEEAPPDWPTGQELVVANSGAIYVSTICDMEGAVVIEVWTGDYPRQEHDPIYDGMLEVRNAGALVGSVTGNHLGHLPLLREGEHRVRVFTDTGAKFAEHVYFVID